MLSQVLGCDVHSDEALLWVYFAVELHHLLQILEINHKILLILVEVLRNCKATVDVDLTSIESPEECSYYKILVLWFPEVVVQNVGCDGGVDHTVKLLDGQAEV
jgi:hypothetical protein